MPASWCCNWATFDASDRRSLSSSSRCTKHSFMIAVSSSILACWWISPWLGAWCPAAACATASATASWCRSDAAAAASLARSDWILSPTRSVRVTSASSSAFRIRSRAASRCTSCAAWALVAWTAVSDASCRRSCEASCFSSSRSDLSASRTWAAHVSSESPSCTCLALISCTAASAAASWCRSSTAWAASLATCAAWAFAACVRLSAALSCCWRWYAKTASSCTCEASSRAACALDSASAS
mmetsp:Transcript_120035/g.340290  ORF Transcript_120035/g.340290 Transcript_120035/m.340290 type:complete len:242 (-) Transcript_120035:900-1625(-)